MTQWRPAAVRGHLSVDVYTVKRAYYDRLEAMRPLVEELKGDPIRSLEMRHRGELFRFLLRIFPDQSEPYEAMFATADDVRVFIRDMEPRETRLFVAEGESEEVVAAAINGQVH